MTVIVDLAPYGARTPNVLARAVIALTRRLPANWLGLRLSMPLRRIAIDWLRVDPSDTMLWGAQVRLYPQSNSCEKNALFTPQMLDVVERNVLAEAIDRRLAEGGTFTFVDVGANVGLYSLFVASRGGSKTRILAAEPQPGIVDRLLFNTRSNPGFNIAVAPVAVTDRDGEVELVIHASDSGGTHLNFGAVGTNGAETVCVPCRPLAAILAEAGFSTIDALKIDVEGAEHLVLAPFLRETRKDLLPRLVVIEDRSSYWPVDLYEQLRQRGYLMLTRSKINIIFRLA